MLMLYIAAGILFVAGLLLLFSKRFVDGREMTVGPVKTPLGAALAILGMAGFAFPHTAWYQEPSPAQPSPNSSTASPTTISSPLMTAAPPDSTPAELVTLQYPSDGTSVSR